MPNPAVIAAIRAKLAPRWVVAPHFCGGMGPRRVPYSDGPAVCSQRPMSRSRSTASG